MIAVWLRLVFRQLEHDRYPDRAPLRWRAILRLRTHLEQLAHAKRRFAETSRFRIFRNHRAVSQRALSGHAAADGGLARDVHPLSALGVISSDVLRRRLASPVRLG